MKMTRILDAIARSAANRVDGSTEMLVADVFRRREVQVCFLAEHRVDSPAGRA
jgi:hypothetical protein